MQHQESKPVVLTYKEKLLSPPDQEAFRELCLPLGSLQNKASPKPWYGFIFPWLRIDKGL